MKHKTEGNRLTRKLTALRQEAWRRMRKSLATQHEWFAAMLRGHYGYCGRAVISEIREDGRVGRLYVLLDTGQQQWVLWAQFHNTGKWLAIGMKELQPTNATAK